jgi:hypothetical protein
MAVQLTIQHSNGQSSTDAPDDTERHLRDFDEEIDETEDDLIENYRFLTQHCGALRQSPTIGLLNKIQQQKPASSQPQLLRAYASLSEPRSTSNLDDERSISSAKGRCSPVNDLNNNTANYSSSVSRVPPTIYYDDPEEDDLTSTKNRPFSLVRLFARMKARLTHDRRYRPHASHELLSEEDPQEWYELTKNVRTVLTKALLPDGGYDVMIAQHRTTAHRRNSSKKSRDRSSVLIKDIDADERIRVSIDEHLNAETDPDCDQINWANFLTCSRGFHYRRSGVCKAIDRQYFQGQLVYFYGVANNILIDENLKASGLG